MTYKPEVLKWSRERAHANEKFKQMIGDVRENLETGIPVQLVLKELVNTGLEENIATGMRKVVALGIRERM